MALPVLSLRFFCLFLSPFRPLFLAGERVIFCDLAKDKELFEGPEGDTQVMPLEACIVRPRPNPPFTPHPHDTTPSPHSAHPPCLPLKFSKPPFTDIRGTAGTPDSAPELHLSQSAGVLCTVWHSLRHATEGTPCRPCADSCVFCAVCSADGTVRHLPGNEEARQAKVECMVRIHMIAIYCSTTVL